MDDHVLIRLLRRYRPRYGWLPLALLLAVLACVALSVLEVEWVPEDGVVVPLLGLGFLLGARLAVGRAPAGRAWAVLALVGAALTLLLVARLWPPPAVVAEGAAGVVAFWTRQMALFADRVAGWYRAVAAGGRSTETVVFTLGLAGAAWLVGAALAWSAYRARRPYAGLSLAGLALAANTFYGRAGLYWGVVFFGLAITVATYLDYLYREDAWDAAGVDYSSEVRPDLLIYAAGISLGIMSLAMALPAINFRAIAAAFQRQEAVVAAEETLARAFAGVQQPRTDEGAAGAGGLPRAFLLGGDPGLSETVVMTATVSLLDGLPPDTPLSARRWRSVSYDRYTGRGWQRSSERQEGVAAGQPIPPGADVPPERLARLSQSVHWLFDRRATRYTIGRPAAFSHDLTVYWRGADDLVGVSGRNVAPHAYRAETTAARLDAGLATAALDAVPPQLLARYTALPGSVPARVHALARQAAGLDGGASPSPYEQARAIERFLHQYPYTLDLPPPPDDVDVVDFFLFDQQAGFCDYFASAMVVMARSVGLPARLAAGYLPQPPDAAGVQTVRQINAHSWAEVYFAGYGWVEFEPTPPFAPASAPDAPPAPGQAAPTFEPPAPATGVPPRDPQRPAARWAWLLGLAALVAVAGQLWGRRLLARWRSPRPPLDPVQAAFAGLQDSAAAAGLPHRPGQTPAEFAAAVRAALDDGTGELSRAVERLAHLFAVRQYGPDGGAAAPADEARAAWRQARPLLRRRAWRRRLGRADETRRSAGDDAGKVG